MPLPFSGGIERNVSAIDVLRAACGDKEAGGPDAVLRRLVASDLALLMEQVRRTFEHMLASGLGSLVHPGRLNRKYIQA